MRVLGIDCGTEYTGYGIVDLLSDDGRKSASLLSSPRPVGSSAGSSGHANSGFGSDRLVCVTCGAIRVSPRDAMPVRLSRIARGLEELIALHRPDRVALEDVFYAVNVKSALKLGQVRGVAMLTAATAGLDVAEYSPLSIKSAVVGYGRAEKHQVQQMVARLLQLEEIPEPPDAADALAIAICHLHTAATLELQNAGLARRAAR
ncbi:MAG: crossover junction endodeoxyribonuclease RuvC [Terriglobales bacterium]